MIRFVDVKKAFGEKKVLRGLNLEIQKGEVFFILGCSGTGKSVTLKHLVGLLKPDSGKVILDEREIQDCREEEFKAIRKKCGLVFQLPALLDSRNIFDNTTFGIRELPANVRKEKAVKALNAVKLENLIDEMTKKFPPQISYGEQKRIAIARTLLTDPDYLLYDEPTTGLDPVTSLEIHYLIESLSREFGKTSVVVSHDMRNALATADRIAVMDAGKVVETGTPSEIKKSSHPLIQDFLKELQ